jgi:hypothetical protein
VTAALSRIRVIGFGLCDAPAFASVVFADQGTVALLQNRADDGLAFRGFRTAQLAAAPDARYARAGEPQGRSTDHGGRNEG